MVPCVIDHDDKSKQRSELRVAQWTRPKTKLTMLPPAKNKTVQRPKLGTCKQVSPELWLLHDADDASLRRDCCSKVGRTTTCSGEEPRVPSGPQRSVLQPHQTSPPLPAGFLILPTATTLSGPNFQPALVTDVFAESSKRI